MSHTSDSHIDTRTHLKALQMVQKHGYEKAKELAEFKLESLHEDLSHTFEPQLERVRIAKQIQVAKKLLEDIESLKQTP